MPGNLLTRSSGMVLLEAVVGRGQRADVRVFEQRGEDWHVVVVDAVNLVDATARERFVARLPDALHADASAAAAELAAEVVELRHGRPRGGDTPAQGSAFTLADPEPWEHPVNGAALLSAIAGLMKKYIVMSSEQADAVALWVLHAHAHEAAYCSPLLAVTSAEKRSGKTHTITILTELVPRPLATTNTSAAAFFRAVELFRPTILFDEADTFLDLRREMQGMLNAGHGRKTAYVLRTVGEDFTPRVFSTWAPKVIARIGDLADTLADRSIPIRLRRRLNTEPVAPLRADQLPAEGESLRRQAWRWAQDRLDTLQSSDPTLPDALHDRQRDNWRPLMAIADVAGADWPRRARAAAIALSRPLVEGRASTFGQQLLLDLRDLVAEWRKVHPDDRMLPSATILQHLHGREDGPWREYSASKNVPPAKLTPHTLAKLLRPYEIEAFRTNLVRGYSPSALAGAIARYVPDAAGASDDAGAAAAECVPGASQASSLDITRS